MPQTRFIYFDMGNVLLFFDHHLAARQMGEVAGVSEQQVWDLVFATDLELRYEAGEVDDRGFYEIFCRQFDVRPDYDAFLLAGSNIFQPNISIYPVVNGLLTSGHRLGVLSNTCPAHWAYCYPRGYAILERGFSVFALSFELGACKPSPKIFAGAARLAGVAPNEIFFIDDMEKNVAGARAAGFDAVQYTTAPQLVADLRARGIAVNY